LVVLQSTGIALTTTRTSSTIELTAGASTLESNLQLDQAGNITLANQNFGITASTSQVFLRNDAGNTGVLVTTSGVEAVVSGGPTFEMLSSGAVALVGSVYGLSFSPTQPMQVVSQASGGSLTHVIALTPSGTINSQQPLEQEWVVNGQISTTSSNTTFATFSIPLSVEGISYHVEIRSVSRISTANTGSTVGDTITLTGWSDVYNNGGTLVIEGSAVYNGASNASSNYVGSGIAVSVSSATFIVDVTLTVPGGKILGTADTSVYMLVRQN
jgi:hypothetical protein